MKSIYCPKCDKRVNANVQEDITFLSVRGIGIETRQLHATCPCCGTSIADEDMTRQNLDSALSAYRAKTGLLSPKGIREAYTKYELTQKSFAVLLGLGAATLSRYEHGALQTKQIDDTIRRATKPGNMLSLIAEKGGRIPAEQANRARKAATRLLADNTGDVLAATEQSGNFSLVFPDVEPSEWNGFRRFDLQCVIQMVVYMAKNCNSLGRTRLNKALFYSDFACFAETSCSMSGLKYARASQGPVVDGFDMLFGEMVRRGYLLEEQKEIGPYDATIYGTDCEFDPGFFTDRELSILKKVAEFVNGFETAKSLSDYTHREKIWIEHKNGEILSFLEAFELNDLDRFVS